MRIIHMISGGDVGGAKTHVLSLLDGLNKTEDVHLICFTEGEFAQEARRLGIPTTVLCDGSLFSVRRRILAMIRHDGYQVIHCHGARANMMGMLLRRRAAIPVISTIHSDYRLDYMGRPFAALTYGTINKFSLRRLDAWIGVSDGMSQLMISRGFDPQRIFTLYNGIDFTLRQDFPPREAYLRELGVKLEPDSVVFGIATRISPLKDMATLIRAFAGALQSYPHIRLVIAGDGPQEAEMRRLADKLCPPGSVCFAGWVKEINRFYHALDVNLLTSLSETFPYALTEGARMSCATISTDVGGIPYLIDDGVNGLLFHPKDAARLTEHICFFASHPQARRKMGHALYEKARRMFSFDTMVQTQKKYYEILIRRAGRPIFLRDGAVISGAYGLGNGGDNAILDAIVAQLGHIDPDLPICVLSRRPKQTRLGAHVSAVHSFRLLKIWRLLRRSDFFLSGGGTLLQDVTSTRSLRYYLFILWLASHAGCRVMLYGCGIGPIRGKRNRKLTARILDRCVGVITVRDGYSADLLEELGVTVPRIHVTADPALLSQPLPADAARSYLLRCGLEKGRHYVMLALRTWEGFEERIPAFAAAAEYACREYGLIPLFCLMEEKSDAPAAHAVAKRLRCPYLTVQAGNSGGEILALVHRMSLVISMRLHALVFASGQGVPLVGVVYDPKVSAFLDHLGQDLYLPLQETNGAALCDLIDAALAERRFEGENIRRLRRLAEENEEILRSYLDGE